MWKRVMEEGIEKFLIIQNAVKSVSEHFGHDPCPGKVAFYVKFEI